MTTPKDSPFHRILVIDDNSAIHEDFRKILLKKDVRHNYLNEMESTLFGLAPQTVTQTFFEIDCASQGKEGLALVKQAQAAGRPYALAFVDGRMPPGWDGIETSAISCKSARICRSCCARHMPTTPGRRSGTCWVKATVC